MVKNSFREISDLPTLRKLMLANAVTRLYLKKLSPNDNSKNQPYLGGDFEALNIIPNHGPVVANDDKGRPNRFKAQIDLYWIDGGGHLCPAPNAQLILYPQYPEVRMSGFLKGCENAPSEMMASRLPGRLMFLGIRDDGHIIGHVVGPENPLVAEISRMTDLEPAGVFLRIPLTLADIDTKGKLIAAFREIHLAGWLNSSKLGPDGLPAPYSSPNGGGYTLEAHLGISPNGYAEPDFHGWEVKQHGVKALDKPHSGGPITLFTPEPTGGFYREKGVEQFLRRFGYPDKKGRPDRINFGGIYRYGVPVASTKLTLHLAGYDASRGKIMDPAGGIALLTGENEPAALWLYADLLKHWNRKHAQAAYVPSISRTESVIQYRYGNKVALGQGTDFLKFLSAVAAGSVYYDPGIKLENASTTKPVTKRRSQFRIKSAGLAALYDRMNEVDILQVQD